MGDRISIVVVEDNPTDVFLINEALVAHGLHADITVCDDGDKAIGLIGRIEAEESEPCPQLILLDLNLPGTDGFAVLERLRKGPRCAAIRVIVMSSSAVPSDRNRSISLGADAYFQKQMEYSASLEIGAMIRGFLE